uniref:XMAP215/Dis1/CLASP TOG domain-containing protein n=1 Tax=Glossina brevipalpis TaxID=37001 RepID=A0A1A9WU97_9MUSC
MRSCRLLKDIFVENSEHAGKTVGDVQKCPAAQKAKTKDLPIQLTLMYVKIENQEAIMKKLIKGMDHKNPKIVAACVAATSLALKEFDSKMDWACNETANIYTPSSYHQGI